MIPVMCIFPRNCYIGSILSMKMPRQEGVWNQSRLVPGYRYSLVSVCSDVTPRSARASAKHLEKARGKGRKNIDEQMQLIIRTTRRYKQRVLMHGHQGWNVRHSLCHIYMIYVYIWVVYSFCLFCCLFIIVTTQFVALYKPCKPKPKFR